VNTAFTSACSLGVSKLANSERAAFVHGTSLVFPSISADLKNGPPERRRPPMPCDSLVSAASGSINFSSLATAET
jgi:hypothetical protein